MKDRIPKSRGISGLIQQKKKKSFLVQCWIHPPEFTDFFPCNSLENSQSLWKLHNWRFIHLNKNLFFSCCFCSVTTVIFFAHKLYLHEKEKYISTILKEFWLWCLCWIFLFPPDLTHCGLPKALVHFLCASSGVQLNYLPYMKLYWKILFYVLSLSSTLSLLFFSFMIT